MTSSPLRVTDLSQLTPLQPDGWSDIRNSFQFYLQHSFCHPICVKNDGRIIGIGSCVIHGTTAWLCHIIVHPEERGRGIGKFITDALVRIIGGHLSVKTILLLATKLGAPVYKKSGFEIESEYIFYKDGSMLSSDQQIVPCDESRFHEVLDLDRKISGEERTEVLSLHRNTCMIKLVDDKVDGFYFPTLGDGVIIAQSPATGLELMRLRAQRESKFVIPEQNIIAADFLSHHGYQPFLQGTRMRLGKKIEWHPEHLYNRIGGNLG